MYCCVAAFVGVDQPYIGVSQYATTCVSNTVIQSSSTNVIVYSFVVLEKLATISQSQVNSAPQLFVHHVNS